MILNSIKEVAITTPAMMPELRDLNQKLTTKGECGCVDEKVFFFTVCEVD
jgi:hypothetical protein